MSTQSWRDLRYLVRLSNTKHRKPEQVDHISQELNETASKFGASLRNFRVSEYAIEFDLFVKNVKMQEEVVQVLVSQNRKLLNLRELGEERRFKDKQHVIALTKDLFNEQRYWECHEVMESIWRKERFPDEKELQQGVILVASALVHAQRNEMIVCFAMVAKALDRLKKWNGKSYLGLDIVSLQQDLMKMLETKHVSFPRV